MLSEQISFSWLDSRSGTRPPSCQGSDITPTGHTRHRRTPLEEWSARPGIFYLTASTLTREMTSMSSAEFKPAFPASERPQTHVLDHAATGFIIRAV